MADVLGLGMSHSPLLCKTDRDMLAALRRTLASERVPDAAKDPRNWPAGMREEWDDDEGVTAARQHRERCFTAIRSLRTRLDRFKPDAVVILGDDQYENFTEDVVPPFCVYITDAMASRPFAAEPGSALPVRNIWNEGPETVFSHRGHPGVGRWLANQLSAEGISLPYAYRLRYERGLAHAFINTLLFLDVDRKGFPYPVVPFQVNCYGRRVIAQHGSMAALGAMSDEERLDPPSPAPWRCFDLGRAAARVMAASPWRVALIASSSWSHAFLTPKHHLLYPDVAADRAMYETLRAGDYDAWRSTPLARIEDSGQQEMLNWLCLAGAMAELGRRPSESTFVESHIFNSNKVFAVFPPA